MDIRIDGQYVQNLAMKLSEPLFPKLLGIINMARLLHLGRKWLSMEISDEEITKIIQTSDQKYLMHVDDKMFSLQDILIEKTKIPVRKPTTRGGVYFTDTVAYKIKASTGDMSILSLLPKIMLGPNTEFVPVEIRTSVRDDNKTKNISLVCHVSNTINTKTRVQLNLILDRIIS